MKLSFFNKMKQNTEKEEDLELVFPVLHGITGKRKKRVEEALLMLP